MVPLLQTTNLDPNSIEPRGVLLARWLFSSQPTGQSSDLAASDCETMIHQERIGQASPIERAVNLHGHNGLASRSTTSMTSSVTLTAKIS
jgi:hypothetical protein